MTKLLLEGLRELRTFSKAYNAAAKTRKYLPKNANTAAVRDQLAKEIRMNRKSIETENLAVLPPRIQAIRQSSIANLGGDLGSDGAVAKHAGGMDQFFKQYVEERK